MYREIRRETWVFPVPGRPTMMMMSLSEAVAPTTSRGVAFSPSGITCGLGLSIMVAILGIAFVQNDGLNVGVE